MFDEVMHLSRQLGSQFVAEEQSGKTLNRTELENTWQHKQEQDMHKLGICHPAVVGRWREGDVSNSEAQDFSEGSKARTQRMESMPPQLKLALSTQNLKENPSLDSLFLGGAE